MLSYLICCILHRAQREVLLPGVLPYDFDAVVFCWQCDSLRGRGLQVLDWDRNRAVTAG